MWCLQIGHLMDVQEAYTAAVKLSTNFPLASCKALATHYAHMH